MLHICRAEDGQVFQVNASLWDIERLGSLELFLQQETGVDQDSVLAYLSDGRLLRSENVRELAGAHDQAIYVYNKRYLDIDFDRVLQELHVDPPLGPPIEEAIDATPPFRPSQLATSYLRTAHTHKEHVANTLNSLRYQHEALRIASTSLDLNVLAIMDVFEGISQGAQKDLEKQEALLAAVDADLEIISRVKIHAEFMSPATRKAVEAGERARTLGDYVSNAKMKQVAETCARTHGDLRSAFTRVEDAVSKLNYGTDEVRAVASATGVINDSDQCWKRSQETFEKITDTTASLESPNADADRLLQDLRQLDGLMRNDVVYMASLKNTYTERCISALRRISTLNDDLVQLPPALSSLQASFRVKSSFSHIQRLHNMMYAYGATIVEIVRRKEFSRFFYQRAQGILEVMAKLSAAERKRRQVYRGEMHGQLPFDVKGMDDAVPTVDFTPDRVADPPYSLERVDVDDLIHVLDDLEHFAKSTGDAAAISSVEEARTSLERLIGKMDGIESGFDRIAERSLLSASWLESHRRRSTEEAYEELAEQFKALQQANAEQATNFQAERDALAAEVANLRSAFQGAESVADTSQGRVETLERELRTARTQTNSDAEARRILEVRNTELLEDAEKLRSALAEALGDATEQTRRADKAMQELSQMEAEYRDVKIMEERHALRITALLEDQTATLRNLEEARSKGEDLKSQIESAYSESEGMRRALEEAKKEKDRLLRAQASEHDRIIRDHIAEADGDRAVLEHQFSEFKTTAETSEKRLKEARSQTEVALADAKALREELQRTERELRETRHTEAALRADLRDGRASQFGYEQRIEESDRLIAQLLDVAIQFRNSHVKAAATGLAVSSHPTSGKPQSANNATDSIIVPHSRNLALGPQDEPLPIDPSDPQAALDMLRAVDHDHLLDVVNKAGSTIRKWQKQCKEYRDRSKGKISFRNFAKGDLALFLPTKNSESKPWAAFNVSFPHYFLHATGQLAEQLKTREWIVARITSITERVVDHRDPLSNPYRLGDGVKYYMLEVEDWTQPVQTQASKRRAYSRRVTSPAIETEPKTVLVEEPLPVPAEPEVEEPFTAPRPFPTRSRANSTPSAGPSSLSRLLAQATPDPIMTLVSNESQPPPEVVTDDKGLEVETAEQQEPQGEPEPGVIVTVSPSPPPIAIPLRSSPQPQSPMRPGSRSSKVSMTSRMSIGRKPGGSVTGKATPTTAITGSPAIAGKLPGELPAVRRSGETPTPEEYPSSDGMSNLLKQHHRRRSTSSYSMSRGFPLTSGTTTAISHAADIQGSTDIRNETTAAGAGSRLASLATSWGVTFGRRRKATVLDSIPQVSTNSDDQPGGSGHS